MPAVCLCVRTSAVNAKHVFARPGQLQSQSLEAVPSRNAVCLQPLDLCGIVFLTSKGDSQNELTSFKSIQNLSTKEDTQKQGSMTPRDLRPSCSQWLCLQGTGTCSLERRARLTLTIQVNHPRQKRDTSQLNPSEAGLTTLRGVNMACFFGSYPHARLF